MQGLGLPLQACFDQIQVRSDGVTEPCPGRIGQISGDTSKSKQLIPVACSYRRRIDFAVAVLPFAQEGGIPVLWAEHAVELS
jgi:hypothetical protein